MGFGSEVDYLQGEGRALSRLLHRSADRVLQGRCRPRQEREGAHTHVSAYEEVDVRPGGHDHVDGRARGRDCDHKGELGQRYEGEGGLRAGAHRRRAHVHDHPRDYRHARERDQGQVGRLARVAFASRPRPGQRHVRVVQPVLDHDRVCGPVRRHEHDPPRDDARKREGGRIVRQVRGREARCDRLHAYTHLHEVGDPALGECGQIHVREDLRERVHAGDRAPGRHRDSSQGHVLVRGEGHGGGGDQVHEDAPDHEYKSDLDENQIAGELYPQDRDADHASAELRKQVLDHVLTHLAAGDLVHDFVRGPARAADCKLGRVDEVLLILGHVLVHPPAPKQVLGRVCIPVLARDDGRGHVPAPDADVHQPLAYVYDLLRGPGDARVGGSVHYAALPRVRTRLRSRPSGRSSTRARAAPKGAVIGMFPIGVGNYGNTVTEHLSVIPQSCNTVYYQKWVLYLGLRFAHCCRPEQRR